MSSLLDDIDVALERGDSIAQIKYEETLLPNAEHAFSFFKKTYLDAKEIWLYEYRFECPGILKKLNDTVKNKISGFNGFEITIAVCCNSINHNSLRNCARITYTLEMTTERGYKITLDHHESTYSPRTNYELFADSLFRIKLGTISTIFANIDSIYDYLSTINCFRGYNF